MRLVRRLSQWLGALVVSAPAHQASAYVDPDDREAAEVERLWPEAGAEAGAAAPPEPDHVVRLSLKGTHGNESTPFRRDSLRLRVESEHPETLLRLEAVMARYQEAGAELTRPSLGALMRQLLPFGLAVRGDVRFFFLAANTSRDDVGIEYGVELQARLASLELRLGGRRRSLLDAPPGWEPVASLQDQGYGGSTLASLRERIMLSEATAGVSWSPIRGSWSYVNVALGTIDGNTRRAITAGAGLDVLSLFRIQTPVALTVLYGLDDLAFSEPSDRFWAPHHAQIHNAGVDLRWTEAQGPVYGLEASLTFGADVSLGYFAGAFVRQPVGMGIALEGRLRVSDNSVFEVFDASAGVVAEL